MKSYQVRQFVHHGWLKRGHNIFMIIKLVFKYDVNMLSFYSNVWETLVLYMRNGNITLIPIIRDVRVEMSRKILLILWTLVCSECWRSVYVFHICPCSVLFSL